MSKKKSPITITHSHLLQGWDYEKNIHGPENYTHGSGQKVWWKCEKNHSYFMQIRHKITANQKCPYCQNKKVLTGFNDLATTDPELAKEWSPKNSVKPSEVTRGCGKRVIWECSLGHEWETTPNMRTNKHLLANCPVCSGKKVLAGYNDLATLRPEFVSQWSSRNKLLPSEVSKNSGKKVWWICENSHEWEAIVDNRAKRNDGCPHCRQSSGEKQLADFVESIVSNVLIFNDRKLIYPYELDIYIPDLRIAVEYNGDYWHSDVFMMDQHGMSAREYHQMKVDKCRNQGIDLLFVWEDDWNDKRDVACLALENCFDNGSCSPILRKLVSGEKYNE